MDPSAAPRDELPAYDPLQSAFHDTFRDELYRAIDALPLRPGMRVLDAPCGDGFYARRLADRLAPGGRLTAADASPAYLKRAAAALADVPAGVAVGTREVDVYALPFPDASFDLVWCAQSLISLKDAVKALREFARVTRPGGYLAVLEADEFHHILLPWPVGLEVAIQAAIVRESRRRYGTDSRLAPARHLRGVLAEAGWVGARKRTVAADRQPPFRPCEAEFLSRHLRFWGNLVRADLSPADRAAFDIFAGDGPDGFVNQPDAEMTCINAVHLARKP